MGSSAYGQGFSDAILNDKAPYLEETNALLYAITTQLAYLFQKGVPEWDAMTTYYTSSFVQYDGVLYQSVIDNNLNLTPSSNPSAWQQANTGGGGGVSAIGQPVISLDDTLADYEIWLEGAQVSRTTYSNLFNIYGTTYGAGDGVETFALPDFRERTICGNTEFGYVEAGLPNITGTIRGNKEIRLYYSTGCFNLYDYGEAGQGNVLGNTYRGFNLDASLSSPIYGNSETVQPPAVNVRIKTRYK